MMKRILVLLTVMALMVVMMVATVAPAFAARPEDHFLNPDSGVLFDAGPGGPEDQGKAPGRVFIGGHDDTQGHQTACDQIGENDVDEQTPIFEGDRGCRVFLPGVEGGVGGRDHPPENFQGNN